MRPESVGQRLTECSSLTHRRDRGWREISFTFNDLDRFIAVAGSLRMEPLTPDHD